MSRTRRSARQAGSRFERVVADYLATHLDDRIDRRVRMGAKDRGDLAGVRHMGERVTVECKDVARTNLAGWASEAECERGNDDGGSWLIVHKRHGVGVASEQWVTTTLGELVALLSGSRDHLDAYTGTAGSVASRALGAIDEGDTRAPIGSVEAADMLSAPSGVAGASLAGALAGCVPGSEVML